MSKIKDKLDELNVTDVYSLMLFALYKMTGDAEYSTLSELVYVMDKDNLMNFLEVFGGLTIKVPTIKELKVLINALYLYQMVNIDNMELEDASKQLASKDYQLKDIMEAYVKVCEVLSSYDFRRK